MNQEKLLKNILSELKELKAQVAQLGPVDVHPTIEQEVAAIREQGVDLVQYFKDQGRQ